MVGFSLSNVIGLEGLKGGWAGALTPDGTCELNEYLMKRFSLKKSDLDNTIERERREAEKKYTVTTRA